MINKTSFGNIRETQQFATSAASWGWSREELVNYVKSNGGSRLCVQRAVRAHREQVARG